MNTLSKLRSKTWVQNNTFKIQFLSGIFAGFEHDIRNIQLPDFTRSAIEEYVNGDWQFARGRQEMYQLAITFNENEQDQLYVKALENWDNEHLNYADENTMDIDVLIVKKKDRSTPLFGVRFKNAIIDSISGLTLDHSTKSEILLFTVNFKTAEIEPLRV